MRLTFCGGASTVTGSNFLVESDNTKILADCGLEQGDDFSVEAMYGPFPYDPRSVTALLVTHAHLDHVGRIPKLVREGFTGTIYSTPPTRDLAELIMRDSVNILLDEAKRLNRAPLYQEQDVDSAMRQWQTIEYHTETAIGDCSVYLRNTGHILGSASMRVRATDGSTAALTGDIGNSPSPLLPDWEPITDTDALVMESVYGDRVHPMLDQRRPQLLEILQKAVARGGTILMPAFALERTQLMLHELNGFFAEKLLPGIPVYLDSPLAIEITSLYEKWGAKYFKSAAEAEMQQHSLFDFPFLRKTKLRQESEAIARDTGQKIIIAGAGMSHGGRIGRHEQLYLPDPKSTLIIVGYQAPGSPGRLMQDGARSVKINGQTVPIRAHVDTLEGWSAHADRDGLLKFAEESLKGKQIKTIFTALGEPSAERFLAQRIHDYVGGTAIVPEAGQTWEIGKDSVQKSK